MPIQAASPEPAIGSAVVVDGTKYRIRSIAGGSAHALELAQAGPAWRHNPVEIWLSLERVELRWDSVASVFRVRVL